MQDIKKGYSKDKNGIKKEGWRKIDKLPRVQNPQALAVLSRVLKDKDLKVRKAAVLTLEQWRGTQVIDLLIEALEDEDWIIRRRAVSALGQFKFEDPRVVKTLMLALKDDNQIVRQEIQQVLGLGHDPATINPLVTLIKGYTDHEFQTYRETESPNSLVEKVAFFIDQYTWQEVADLGEHTLELLRCTLKNEDPRVRESTRKLLSALEEPDFVFQRIRKLKIGLLMYALSHEDQNISRKVIEVLLLLEEFDALEPLIKKLKIKDFGICKLIFRVLWKTEDIKIARTLINIVEDEDWRICELAAHGLKNLKKISLPLLVQHIKKQGDLSMERLIFYLKLLAKLKPTREQLTPLHPLLLSVIFTPSDEKVTALTKELLKTLA
ncbi:MAG: HEAT repeat domain-containing protein [Candidatus Hodarchaeota archaeon]